MYLRNFLRKNRQLQPLRDEFYADFREATCRQHAENTCNCGGYCNFMYLKKTIRDSRKKLFQNRKMRCQSRSISHNPHREYDRRDKDDQYANGRGSTYSGGDEHRYDRDDRRGYCRRDDDRAPSPASHSP